MFLDREEQRNIILNSLSNNKSVFIYAESGIGKSALCDEVLKDNPHTVVVKRRNSRGLFDEGDIILRMCQEINNKADALKINTFREYVKKYKIPTSFMAFLSAIDSLQIGVNLSPTVVLTLPFIFIAKCLIKFFVPRKVRDRWRKPNGDKVNLLQCKKYLNYALDKNKDLIFDINNIQEIDKTSFDYILDLIKRLGIRFLLQFTGEHSYVESFYRNNLIEINDRLCPLPLPFLPEEETQKLIDIYYDSESDKDLLLSEFLRNGNLNPIVKINMNKKVYSFSPHENAVISLLKIFNGKIRKTRLFKHMKNITDLNRRELNNILYKLEDIQIIFRESGYFTMGIIECEDSLTAKATVFRELRNNFRKHTSNLKLLQLLIPSFLEFDPQGLLEYLPQVRQIMLYIADQGTALRFIEQFKSVLTRNNTLNKQANLFIIDIYYSLAMYKEAYEYLLGTETADSVYAIYKAMLLNRLDFHKESNKVISSMLNQMEVHETIIALNIQLINYASLRNRDLMLKTYNEILAIKDVSKYPEYQFTLRNCHLVLKRSEAEKNIKECIKYYKSHGDTINVNQAQISLAMLYILDKKDKTAKKILTAINKRVNSQAMELSVSLNNLATIYMTQEKYIDAEKYLQDAEQMCLDLFSELSIFGNILTVKTQMRDVQIGKSYVEKILNLIDDEPDKKLKSCLYDEIAHYYSMTNDIDTATLYAELSQKMLDEISTNHVITNTAVQTSLGFIINQLAFWHFDLFPLLECSR